MGDECYSSHKIVSNGGLMGRWKKRRRMKKDEEKEEGNHVILAYTVWGKTLLLMMRSRGFA